MRVLRTAAVFAGCSGWIVVICNLPATGRKPSDPATVITQPKQDVVAVVTDRLVRSSPVFTHSELGWVGVIAPRFSIDLAPKRSGRLEAVHVRLGDHVARGSCVATLESRSVKLDIAAAQASLLEAQAARNKASLELAQVRRRYQWLTQLPDARSEMELADAAHAQQVAVENLKIAEARAQQQSAHVSQLRETLADSQVVAPFNGTVAACYQDLGAMVAPDTPVLRVISSDELLVRFAVPEHQSALLRPGTAIEFRPQSTADVISGVVERISPELDAASQILFMEARLNIPPELRGRIHVGVDGRVAISQPLSTRTPTSQPRP